MLRQSSRTYLASGGYLSGAYGAPGRGCWNLYDQPCFQKTKDTHRMGGFGRTYHMCARKGRFGQAKPQPHRMAGMGLLVQRKDPQTGLATQDCHPLHLRFPNQCINWNFEGWTIALLCAYGGLYANHFALDLCQAFAQLASGAVGPNRAVDRGLCSKAYGLPLVLSRILGRAI